MSRIRFEAGARTNWHIHDTPQLLLVEEGRGRLQELGSAVREFLPGQPVLTKPNVLHWHGAAPDQAAVQFSVFSGKLEWKHPVTDEEYLGKEMMRLIYQVRVDSRTGRVDRRRVARRPAEHRRSGRQRSASRAGPEASGGHLAGSARRVQEPVALADLLRRLHRAAPQPAEADHAGERRPARRRSGRSRPRAWRSAAASRPRRS